jgi:hypothetical protein
VHFREGIRRKTDHFALLQYGWGQRKAHVIGKSARLRFFNGLDIREFPVDWHSDIKAWMTREIMIHWLQNFGQENAGREEENSVVFG